MDHHELKKILELHELWLKSGGKAEVKANLSGANLSGANLSRADLMKGNLSWANLSWANLSWANLSRANLSRADLSGANLSEANLSRADLSGANLSRADLRDADLSEADLIGANLSGANLSRADLSKADLSQTNLNRTNLSRAGISNADLSKSDLSKADLIGANLSRANLSRANLSRANLSEANLSEANLSGANLSETDLIGANLSRVDLRDADLSGANLSGANLIGANLSRADLIEADLIEADLRDADLRDADLSEADLIGANLSGANLSEADLSGANLTGADLSRGDLGRANLENANLLFTKLRETIFSETQLERISIFDKDLFYIPNPLKDKYIDTFKIFKTEIESPNTIIRSIEFPPEYHQAGMSILSYFSKVMQDKYPEEKVKVRIEQDFPLVTMIIETEDGQTNKIEKELVRYGLVVKGKISAEQYCENPLEAMALKQKLEMAAMEVKHTRELMYTERNQYESRISSLENVLGLMLQKKDQQKTSDINVNVNLENVGSPTVTANASSKATVINKNELTRKDKSQINALVDAIERSLGEFKVRQDNEKKVVELIESIKQDLKKNKPDFFGVRDNLNSMNNLLQGAGASLIASGLLGQVPGIISRIFG